MRMGGEGQDRPAQVVGVRWQFLRIVFLELAGEWNPHWRPSQPRERSRMWKRMRMKSHSVMPAHGPTAPPQMSQLGLREEAED